MRTIIDENISHLDKFLKTIIGDWNNTTCYSNFIK